jgi:hypothetical protein
MTYPLGTFGAIPALLIATHWQGNQQALQYQMRDIYSICRWRWAKFKVQAHSEKIKKFRF